MSKITRAKAQKIFDATNEVITAPPSPVVLNEQHDYPFNSEFKDVMLPGMHSRTLCELVHRVTLAAWNVSCEIGCK